jgi:hypothetical protein
MIPEGTFTDDEMPTSLRLSPRPCHYHHGHRRGWFIDQYAFYDYGTIRGDHTPAECCVQPHGGEHVELRGNQCGRTRLTFTLRCGGENGQSIAFEVVNELAATTSPGPYTLNLYPDNPVISLKAVQSGVESRFSYGWRVAAVAGLGRGSDSDAESGEAVARLVVVILQNVVLIQCLGGDDVLLGVAWAVGFEKPSYFARVVEE